MRKHIKTYTSTTGAYQARIDLTDAGNYAVTIFDVDAEATLPAARHYKDLDKAEAYARQCVKEVGVDDLPF